jgi:hypothetical protein
MVGRRAGVRKMDTIITAIQMLLVASITSITTYFVARRSAVVEEKRVTVDEEDREAQRLDAERKRIDEAAAKLRTDLLQDLESLRKRVAELEKENAQQRIEMLIIRDDYESIIFSLRMQLQSAGIEVKIDTRNQRRERQNSRNNDQPS